jgi:multimeric flavodoxin WrbA
MKIFVVNGAPRRGGYTDELTGLFTEGASAAGAEVDVARLSEHDVRPCLGCFACWIRGEGRCAQRDDMDTLLPRYLDADALVLATPIYFYSFSALLKAFVERLFPTLSPVIDVSGGTPMERNSPRFPGRGPKRAVLIAAGAHKSRLLNDGLVATFETICHGLSLERAGVLLRPESFVLDFAEGKPRACGRVRAAFAAAGRELVEAGRVSPGTEQDATLPLTRDLAMFQGHAHAYWEIAVSRCARGFDREAVRDAAAADLRILVPELAAGLDPLAAGKLKAIIQLDVTDDPAGGYHLVIDGGTCAAHKGRCEAPTTALSLDAEALVGLLRGRLDARSALSEGRIRVAGDRSLFARFGRLFSR